jgi:hypothetical protein
MAVSCGNVSLLRSWKRGLEWYVMRIIRETSALSGGRLHDTGVDRQSLHRESPLAKGSRILGDQGGISESVPPSLGKYRETPKGRADATGI